MNTTNFQQILDKCLARLLTGDTIEQCLADYPDMNVELRPLLLAASAVQTTHIPQARPQAVKQGQAKMLAALSNQEQDTAVSFGTLQRYAERIRSVLKQEEASQMRLALRSIVTTILLLFVSGFFALTISTNSLPGEPFYPVKRGWESTRLGLTFNAEARQQLENQIQQNRQQELTALIQLGRQTQFIYEGHVEQIEEGLLTVDGFEIQTNMATLWLLEPIPGAAVLVELEITTEGQLIALVVSASSLDSRLNIIPTATATPCNTPTCSPPTSTPTPCNAGACGEPSPTPILTNTPDEPTPTPCNAPACGPATLTPTPCTAGACNPSPTPVLTITPDNPTATPCNTPSCAPPTATPCNGGACGEPSPTPIPTNTPGDPTPTPCNSPTCGPPTPTPTPCTVGCGGPTTTPTPTKTPGEPTATPCNSPACWTPTPTPTPCTGGGCGGPSPTPLPTNTPGAPTPTPCNSPACGSPTPTPLPCNGGACGGPSPTPTSINAHLDKVAMEAGVFS